MEKFRNVSVTPTSSTPAELARRSENENRLLGEAAKLINYERQ